NLLHERIRVGGICEFSHEAEGEKLVGIFVPSSTQVKIYGSAERAREYSTTDLLTTAAQVRRVKPDDAGKHLRSRIRGVVIFSSPTALVLQDPSGGVFVGTRTGVWAEQPKVGELWEI